MRETKYGGDTAIIGRMIEGKPEVRLKTSIGGKTRLVDMLPGEILPRIC